jgi:hypothetical protein
MSGSKLLGLLAALQLREVVLDWFAECPAARQDSASDGPAVVPVPAVALDRWEEALASGSKLAPGPRLLLLRRARRKRDRLLEVDFET